MGKIPKLKKDKRYKDAPRYPLIFDYEKRFRNNYEKMVNNMTIDLVKKLKEFGRNK